MALQVGIGNFSGVIASNIYRSQDAPRYVFGRTSSRYSKFPFYAAEWHRCLHHRQTLWS